MEESRCIFCSIISGRSKGSVIYQDRSFVALLDKYPFSCGHTLVIPKKHYINFLEMPKDEAGALYTTVWFIAKAVLKAVNPEGLNIGQNNGRAANQIIPHVHVHIIPRFKEDVITGRWPSRRPVPDSELEEISESIRSVLIATNIHKSSTSFV